MRRALITGITGQDGSYLAELLLREGYEVYGLVRRKSGMRYGASQHLADKVIFLEGDMTDPTSLIRAVRDANPMEVYNLASQSCAESSWRQPLYTGHCDGLGVANLLEALRIAKPTARYFQASAADMFGQPQEVPQNENTPCLPRSPYGTAKLYAHCLTRSYREGFGMFACCGILFGHDSERRGPEYVARKITSALPRILRAEIDSVTLGNLSARRDLGHSEDFVKAMHLMLQQDAPSDYVIATGETHTLREFVTRAFAHANMTLAWYSTGRDEYAVWEENSQTVVRVDPRQYREDDIDPLLGDPSKAERELGWRRDVTFNALVGRMVDNELRVSGIY